MRITIEAENGEKSVYEIDMSLAILSENPILYIAREFEFILLYFPPLTKWIGAYDKNKKEWNKKLREAGLLPPLVIINKSGAQLIKEARELDK